VDATPQSVIGNAMKIYLLMLLIGVLLTAIHFTAPSQKPSAAAPQ
jgi:hypothetical protein